MVVRIITVIVSLWACVATAAPDIQHWTTDKGVRVYFFEAPELPMLDVRVVFDAGAARDGDMHGLALLTNGMLAEGAGEWNSDQIAERFEGVGANYGNSSHRDMSVFTLRTLTEAPLMESALTTFTKVISKPNFPQDAYEREKNRLLIGLESRKQDPGEVSDKAFYESLYGSHPYGHMPEGDVESVNKISVDNLKEFYKRYYVARNAVVALVGKVTREQVETIVNSMFADIPQGEPAGDIVKPDLISEAKELVIDFPSTQSHILVGQPGISRDDPDYFPLYVGNHILGGSGLVSTLSEEIREKRGLAYSAYSYFIPMRVAGPFILGLQTKNESANEALNVLRDTLKNFVNKGPSQKELDAAKKNLVGGFALRIASNSKIVENLAAIGFYNLPLDYLDSFISKVEDVTLDQVKQAFQKHVDPEKLLTVVLGDKQQIQLSAK